MVSIRNLIHKIKGNGSQDEEEQTMNENPKVINIITSNKELYIMLTEASANSKLLMRDMTDDSLVYEADIDQEGKAVININKSGLIKQSKCAFYVRSEAEERRLKPTENLGNEISGISHSLEEEDHLIVPYITVKGNVSVKVFRRYEFEKSNDLPLSVNRIQFDNNQAKVKGWLFADSETRSNSRIIMKKRGSSLSYELPAEIKGNEWHADLEFKEFKPSKGTWDYYLEVSDKKKHRIQMENMKPSDGLNNHPFHLQRESRWNVLYKTKNDTLSSKVQAATVQMENVETEVVDDFKIRCSGLLKDIQLNGKHRIDEARVLIAKRNNGKEYHEAIKLVKDENNNFLFDFKLDYRQLILTNENNQHRWDIYLAIPYLDEVIRYRFKINSKEIAYQSRIKFESLTINQVYMYSTVNDQLSIVQKDLSVERNVDSCRLNNRKLMLSGFAYLDTVQWIEKEDLQRNLILRDRENEEDYIIPLAGIRNDLKRFGYSYCHSGFYLEIDLDDFLSSTNQVKKVFDIYVQFQYKGITKERRLGREEFEYFKDDVLDREVISRENDYEIVYLTYTPSGNIKVETNRIPTEAMKYLSQDIEEEKEELWLIGERYNTAQDTGYHFFKFCREYYPNMNIYYALDPDSKDYAEIEHLGNVIQMGSMEHYKVAASATALIGSHDLEYFLPAKGIEFSSYKHGKRIFLQHGVLGRKNVEYHKNYYKYPFHLFCVSSQSEKNLVEKKLGYNKEEVEITGLTRFDSLLDQQQNKKSILFIPTWREWLLNERDFLNSDYYKMYKSMLQNESLQQMLTRYNVELNFFPHYRMQPFVEHFEIQHDLINVIKLEERRIQDLLLENSLMITDYSSVSFDFNYMSKPVVFYHFDQDSFFRKGILRPIEETFIGDICFSEGELIKTITNYVKNNFKERKQFSNQKHLIFSNIDKNNCQRVYDRIQKV
ncbi:CDP-glycerol glycerophosphotransferase family protein [Halobacillus sp. A5]|uniref:CDP-glycerol glycerophosphotransferase family protein n=1 Tax=Halobacillus sp. A5 TaxID=2880263 RepID=UPI0020A65D36|nr:CDP-glycerol glycerophosphotransferase family protein [Halobacillus sp. A5]MCP3028076.1 CDP-glycerol glycerophosphotransferase family protein [Halobacillus sp. A5]